MITEEFGAFFEKKGFSRILYLLARPVSLFSIVIKSGKIAELFSFVVWELFEKLGIYKGSYLEFTNQAPILEFTPAGELCPTNRRVDGSANHGYVLQPLSLDWGQTFTDSRGTLWGSQYEVLFRSEDRGTTATEVYRFPQTIFSIYVSRNQGIFVCAEGVIYKSDDQGRSFRVVFQFATTNSRFRQDYTFTQDRAGNLFVGEYGLATDERGNWQSVAWIYMSEDDGDTWRKNDFFIRQGANKHIHLVKYCSNMQKMVVTDGDNYKRMWVNDTLTSYDQRATRHDNHGWRLVNNRHIQMGGHTAILELDDEILLGTDYLGGTNFLLRTTDFVNFRRSVVPDPYRHSIFQRILSVQAGNDRHLWAWLDNMAVRKGSNAKGLLMYSQDNGHTWTKFIEYDGTHHWQWVVSSSDEVLDYLLVMVDGKTYRIEYV